MVLEFLLTINFDIWEDLVVSFAFLLTAFFSKNPLKENYSEIRVRGA